jgi:uncharacterized protein (DUF924 family)
LTDQINQILEFWFGTETEQKVIIAKQSGLWWDKNADTDLNIKAQFGESYQSAVNDELNDWLKSTRGQLALIILLDQFSRVLNRESADAFSQDGKALAIALEGISNNFDKSLCLIERVFYYMPLEHSEDIDTQNQCVALFQQLLFEAPEELKKEFQGFLQFAEKHRAIIERFRRFPHRNKVLNRISSAEELEFLTQPGSSF